MVEKAARSKKKKRTRKERGEWPTTNAGKASLELAAKKTEERAVVVRAVAAEAEAAKLKVQLEAELETQPLLLDAPLCIAPHSMTAPLPSRKA